MNIFSRDFYSKSLNKSTDGFRKESLEGFLKKSPKKLLKDSIKKIEAIIGGIFEGILVRISVKKSKDIAGEISEARLKIVQNISYNYFSLAKEFM